MRRVIPLVTACLLTLIVAEPLFAQQRLFVRINQEIVEIDSRSASLGTVIRRFPLPGEGYTFSRPKDVVPFGGGEFLAWAGDGVVLLNTRSGAVQRFTFPGFTASQVIGTDGNARLVVLGTNESASDVVLVADARSANLRFLELGRISSFYSAIAYAPASDLLFVAKPRGLAGLAADTYHDIDVIQASTGALLKTLDIWPVSAHVLTTNALGTRLYMGNVAFDVRSGTQFASTTEVYLGGSTLDEHRNRLIGHSVIPPGAPPEQRLLRGISAFSADSLQFLGRVYVPDPPLPAGTSHWSPFVDEQIDVSGLSATTFVLQVVGVQYKYSDDRSCRGSQLIALDADTGRVRRTVDTTNVLGSGACGADLVRITEPAPPLGLTARASGHQVTLDWLAALNATSYEIEAGSAPGLANLATINANDTQLVVSGVPPGVYHLRVRAINTIGKSGASQEVQVVVP